MISSSSIVPPRDAGARGDPLDDRQRPRDRASACGRRRTDTSPCRSSGRAGPSRTSSSATSGLRAPGSENCFELLPHAPRDVEPAQVVDGKDAHRHPEVGQHAIDLLRRRAVLDEELRLVHVGEHHAVADEPGAVADDDADLAEPLGERQRRGEHVVRSVAAPRTISTSRITCAGLKKCRPTTASGRRVAAAIASMSSVDVLVARMAPGLATRVERGEHLLLERHVLEHRLDDHVGRRARRRSRPARAMRAEPLLDRLRRQAAALHRRLVVAPDRRQARVERAPGVASVSTTRRPALAHAIAMPPPIVPAPTIATVARSAGSARPTSVGDARHLRHGALGEEHVDERLALLGAHALRAHSSRSRRQPCSNGSVAAASIASTRRERRGLMRPHLRAPARGRPRAAARSPRACRACRSARASSRCGPPRAATSRANATAPSSEIAVDDAIDQAGGERLGRRDRPAGHAHLDRPLDADQPRQPLRALGAGNDAEVRLRAAPPARRGAATR